MLRTILAGCDGGDRGRSAVALAATLADATGATLRLVAAHPQAPLPYVQSSAEMRRRTALALGRVRDELAPSAATAVVGGLSPAHALTRAAVRRRADLLVVGSRHRGRVGRLFEADQALGVLHGAPCAVAVVPDAVVPRAALRRLVVGLDGSPESLAALALAADVARAATASLWLEVVVSDSIAAWPTGAGLVPPFDETGAPPGTRRAAEQLLLETVDALEDVDVDGAVGVGDPVRRLAEAADTADLVAVGSRRWGPVSRALLGSTSEGVVRRARGPVLVVPHGRAMPAPSSVDLSRATA